MTDDERDPAQDQDQTDDEPVAPPVAEDIPAWEVRGMTRGEVVDRTRRAALLARVQDIGYGEWEGVEVVTKKDIAEAFGEPLPAASDRVAEVIAKVTEPARIVVWAMCPRCGLPVTVGVYLSPVLTVDTHGEIKIKGKTKAVTHLCGQTVMQGAPEDQMTLPDVEAPMGDETLRALLSLVMEPLVPLEVIASWTQPQRDQAMEWAQAMHYEASDNPVTVPERPSFLPVEPLDLGGEDDPGDLFTDVEAPPADKPKRSRRRKEHVNPDEQDEAP